MKAVLSEVPANRVGVRLSPNGVFNDMGSPDFREQFTHVAQQLDRLRLLGLSARYRWVGISDFISWVTR